MSWCPFAERVPWKYLDSSGSPTYYRAMNHPKAAVLHVAQGWQRTARQWAEAGHWRASRHFSIGLDGSIMQHLDFADGGYHAGITVAQARAHPPTWRLWEGPHINCNHYTLGLEHEGFYDHEPYVLRDPRQRAASKRLCEWIAGELEIPLDRDHFPPHAAIDGVNRVNDFDTPERREAWYRVLCDETSAGLEEDMADPEARERLDRLNAAIVNRERLRRLASDPDYTRVEKALQILKAGGMEL